MATLPGLFVVETVFLGRFGIFQFLMLEMQRPQCCCCTHRQAPMWLLHTSTGPIVLLYNSNSPCVATTHSLCGFHTETGVRVRCGSGSGSGRHAAKSGAAGLHTRTQDRFPALRGDEGNFVRTLALAHTHHRLPGHSRAYVALGGHGPFPIGLRPGAARGLSSLGPPWASCVIYMRFTLLP